MTETLTHVREPDFEPDERFIPVDRRWFGMDRRTVAPTLVVLALVFVTAIVLPTVDDVIGYDDEVVAGDVMGLDNGVTFVPEPGWGITRGVRTGSPIAGGAYPDSASVADGSTALTVVTDTFGGDANALMDQWETASGVLDGDVGVVSERTTITTDAGQTGVLEEVAGTTTEGLLVTFVADGVGVAAKVTATADPTPAETDAVARMISSIRMNGAAA